MTSAAQTPISKRMSQQIDIKLFRGALPTSFEQGWDALFAADTDAHVFLSRAFVQSILLRDPDTHLICAFHQGQVVGLFPIHMTTVWDHRRRRYRSDIKMAGSLDWADYTGILVCDELEAPVIDALAAHLVARPWARIRFKHLRMCDRRRDRFFAHFRDDAFGHESVSRKINEDRTDNLLCPAIDLPDNFDTYLDGLSKNTRQKLRRFLRKLDAGDMHIRAGTPDDLGTFQTLWAEQWPDKSNVRARAAKYAAILAKGFDQGNLEMSVLTQPEGQVLGLVASFMDPVHKAVNFFVSARRVSVTDTPVGLILHADSIRRAIANGYCRYDFLRGNEPYKLSLGAVSHAISYPVLRRRSGAPDAMLLSPISLPALGKKIEKALKSGDTDKALIATQQLNMLLGR